LSKSIDSSPLSSCSQLDNNKFIGSGIPDTYGNLSKLAKL